MVYHNYHNKYSSVILRRYFNIQDFVNTASKSVELLPELEFVSYDNVINIMVYYMKYKGISKLNSEYNKQDAHALNLQIMDSLIIEARRIKNALENKEWDEITKYHQAAILNFIDKVIALNLATEKCISLNEMLEIPHENGILFNMDSLNTDYNTIIQNTHELATKNIHPHWN